MKCNKCGEENKDDSVFCGTCGNKLENGTTNISIPDTIYCTKCGRKIESCYKICPNCKSAVHFKIENMPPEKQNQEEQSVREEQIEENSGGTIFVIIYILCLLSFFFSGSILGLLASIIVIITAKINCPNSNIVKTLFWITIIIILIIFSIIAAFIEACGSCG